MSVQKTFQPEPDSAGAVRTFVSEAVPPTVPQDDVVLAASELATNVIRHAHTPFTVRVEHGDHSLRLEVEDGSAIVPALQQLRESERGLRMVDGLSENWGIERTRRGKVVWASFRAR